MKRILSSSIILALILQFQAVCAAEITLSVDPPARRTVTPTEMWRIGGEDDEEILLGLITAAVQGPDDNTYLLDMQLNHVLVLDPEGRLMATLGREGEGPGELRRPHGLFFLDDSRLAVVQGFPGRITLLHLDGTPAGEIRPGGAADEGGFRFVRKAMAAGGRIVARLGKATFDQEKGKATMERFLAVCDTAGAELVRLATLTTENDFRRRTYDEAKEFSPMNQWTLTPSGTIVTAPEREGWVLATHDLDGRALNIIRRPFTTQMRTDEDKEKISSGMVMVMNGRRIPVESHVLDTDPAIMDLNAADDGRLFVTTCFDRGEELPDGIAARYDVLTPAGEFIEQLSLAIDGFDPDQDDVTFLDGRHFLLLRNIQSATAAARAGRGGGDTEAEEDLGEAEPLEAVLYRLP